MKELFLIQSIRTNKNYQNTLLELELLHNKYKNYILIVGRESIFKDKNLNLVLNKYSQSIFFLNIDGIEMDIIKLFEGIELFPILVIIENQEFKEIIPLGIV